MMNTNTQHNKDLDTTKIYRQYKVLVDGQEVTGAGSYLTLNVEGVKRLESKGMRLFLVPMRKDEGGLIG